MKQKGHRSGKKNVSRIIKFWPENVWQDLSAKFHRCSRFELQHLVDAHSCHLICCGLLLQCLCQSGTFRGACVIFTLPRAPLYGRARVVTSLNFCSFRELDGWGRHVCIQCSTWTQYEAFFTLGVVVVVVVVVDLVVVFWGVFWVSFS